MRRTDPFLSLLLLLAACSSTPPTADAPVGGSGAAVREVTANAVLPEFGIAVTPNKDQATGAATDGTNYLVAYVSGNPSTVRARLVSPNGAVLATVNTNRSGVNPQVAFDGTNYLLAWLDNGNLVAPDVNGQFISQAGAKVGKRFRITTTSDAVFLDALCFGGGQYLVTYNRFDVRLHRRFVSTAGTRGGDQAVSSAFGIGTGNACATDGTNFLTVWLDAGNQTVARLVRGDGTFGTETVVDATPDSTLAFMGVAFLSGNYLAVWVDQASPGDWNIYAHLLTASGALSGNRKNIATGTSVQLASAVTANGSNFAIWYGDGVEAPSSATSKVRFLTANGALTGTPQIVFKKKGTRVPAGGPMVANGTTYFFGLNRAVPGPDTLDFSAYTGYDLKGAIGTLVP